MRTILLAGVAALAMLTASVAEEGDAPPPRFKPCHEAWQCNDIRVTVTALEPAVLEYDIGGTIWGGSRFTRIKGGLLFNGRPCLPLQPVGY